MRHFQYKKTRCGRVTLNEVLWLYICTKTSCVWTCLAFRLTIEYLRNQITMQTCKSYTWGRPTKTSFIKICHSLSPFSLQGSQIHVLICYIPWTISLSTCKCCSKFFSLIADTIAKRVETSRRKQTATFDSVPCELFKIFLKRFWISLLLSMKLRFSAVGFLLKFKNVMRCAIWYHLFNLKNVKSTHGGVLIIVKLQASSLQLY